MHRNNKDVDDIRPVTGKLIQIIIIVTHLTQINEKRDKYSMVSRPKCVRRSVDMLDSRSMLDYLVKDMKVQLQITWKSLE